MPREITKAATPKCRIRLTYGSLRTTADRRLRPLVIALPFGSPDLSAGHVAYLEPGQRIGQDALKRVTNAVQAGGSAAISCTLLADAVAAFGDLAVAAGYTPDTAEAMQ